MESAQRRRERSLVRRFAAAAGIGKFPVEVLPAVLGLVVLAAIGSSGAGAAILSSRLRVGVRTSSRRLSRGMSRALADAAAVARGGSPRIIARIVTAVLMSVAAFSLRRLQVALRGFDFSLRMNRLETKIDDRFRERFTIALTKPVWGRGLPVDPTPGKWRPYLRCASMRTARENIFELRAKLGLIDRSVEQMTEDELTEGVRRMLVAKYFALMQATDSYWSEEQARSIARALAAECGLQPAASSTAGKPEDISMQKTDLEGCVPFDRFQTHAPWPTPAWLDSSQRVALSALRMFFHAGFSWRSRFIETPFGSMHVLDTHPPVEGQPVLVGEQPPLLLQHGMFVTGWSMALLGWLLSGGRRVVMPDLFDYVYGYSGSDPSRGWKVRTPFEHVEALTYVVRDLLPTCGEAGVDIAGHSYGGQLIGLLAHRCAQEDLPVRKVVLIAPGGFPCWEPDPMAQRFFQQPLETALQQKPAWMPGAVLTPMLKTGLGLLLNANNVNVVLGVDAGGDAAPYWRSECPTLLLWGDDDAIAQPREPEPLAAYLRVCFPNIEAFWVEGGSHNIQIDSVVAIARAMETWLDGRGVGPAAQWFGGSMASRLLAWTDRPLRSMEWSACPSGHAPADAAAPQASKL